MLILLLYGVGQLLLDELTLDVVLQVSRANRYEVDRCAGVHAPCYFFFDVDAEAKALFQRHLPVVALCWVAAALVGALDPVLGALALHHAGLQLAEPSDGLDGHVFCLVTACARAPALLLGLHYALNPLFLLGLALGQRRAVRAALRIFRISATPVEVFHLPFAGLLLPLNLDLIVLNLKVLPLGRLVKLLVPYSRVAIANEAVPILVIVELYVVVCDPFLEELFLLGADDLLCLQQEVGQVDLGQRVLAPLLDDGQHEGLQVG